MAKVKLTDLDQPVIFALSITLVVIGTMAVMGWFFSSVGWSGPLGLVKGGVSHS